MDESDTENKIVTQVQMEEKDKTTASPLRTSGRRLRNTTTTTSSPDAPEPSTRGRKAANKSTTKAVNKRKVCFESDVEEEAAAAVVVVESEKADEVPVTRRTRGGSRSVKKSHDTNTLLEQTAATR